MRSALKTAIDDACFIVIIQVRWWFFRTFLLFIVRQPAIRIITQWV